MSTVKELEARIAELEGRVENHDKVATLMAAYFFHTDVANTCRRAAIALERAASGGESVVQFEALAIMRKMWPKVASPGAVSEEPEP